MEEVLLSLVEVTVSVIVVTVIVVGTAAQLGPPGPLIKHAWPSSQLTPPQLQG